MDCKPKWIKVSNLVLCQYYNGEICSLKKEICPIKGDKYSNTEQKTDWRKAFMGRTNFTALSWRGK